MHRATLFATRVNLRWKNKGEKMDGTVSISYFYANNGPKQRNTKNIKGCGLPSYSRERKKGIRKKK